MRHGPRNQVIRQAFDVGSLTARLAVKIPSLVIGVGPKWWSNCENIHGNWEGGPMERQSPVGKTYQAFMEEIVDTSEPCEPTEVAHLVRVSSPSH